MTPHPCAPTWQEREGNRDRGEQNPGAVPLSSKGNERESCENRGADIQHVVDPSNVRGVDHAGRDAGAESAIRDVARSRRR
ncbi:MAG: hypothetical protein JWQ68_1125 [Cryobacterium sp.]|jgi:hypothetical protein|nr:hypothetical protein [Cryobacterium sp.]